MAQVDFSEIGRTGLMRSGGFITEEFLRQLSGVRGARAYNEMRKNDSVVSALLFGAETLGKGAGWRVEPAGEEQEDLERAEFLRRSLMDDMSFTFSETLSEIFTFLPYGWAYLEIVYKRRLGDNRDPGKRSRFNDGRIGLRKLAARGQESLDTWDLDETGGIKGMFQTAAPDYQQHYIPIEKALLFRTRAERNNPEGLSILRSAYQMWYFKKKTLINQGIGTERDLAGLPVVTPPEGLDLWNSNDPKSAALLTQAETLVRSIRVDEQQGVVLPHGWDLKLLTTGGRRQFDTVKMINQYNSEIALAMLMDFILLGHEQVGSFALSDSKIKIFLSALTSFLDNITSVINRHLVPRLFAINGWKTENLPTLVHGELDMPDLKGLGEYLQALAGAGMPLFPDEKLERMLLSAAKLERSEERDRM